MKTETKTENELIAEFMGFEKTSTFYDTADDRHYKYKSELFGYTYPSEWAFHIKWDWLMPVVEKIGQLDGDYTVSINTQKEPSLYGHECSIYDTGHAVSFLMESKNLIEAVYKAVVEFIKWHNQLKP
jgi:hypothetical protein